MRTAQQQNRASALQRSDCLTLEVSKHLRGFVHTVHLPDLSVHVSESMTVLQAGYCPVKFGKHLNVTGAFSPKPVGGGVISGNDSQACLVSFLTCILVSFYTKAVLFHLDILSTFLLFNSNVLSLNLWLISLFFAVKTLFCFYQHIL